MARFLACCMVGGALASAPPIAVCVSKVTEQASQIATKKSVKGAADKGNAARHHEVHTSTTLGSGLTHRHALSVETQGLRVSATVDDPLSWFAFENGNLSLREPRPDETLAVRVELSELSSGSSFLAAEVNCFIREDKSSNVLATTRTLIRVWDPQGSYYVQNFALPPNGLSPLVILNLEIGPDERFARSTDVPATLASSPLTVELGPYSIPKKGTTRETPSILKKSPQRLHLEGRHPPVEPTPYPGAKTPD